MKNGSGTSSKLPRLPSKVYKHIPATYMRRISCPIDLNNLHVCIDGSRKWMHIFLALSLYQTQTWCDKQLHMDGNLCAYAFFACLMVMTALWWLRSIVIKLKKKKEEKNTYKYMPFSVHCAIRIDTQAARFRLCCFFLLSFLLSFSIFNWPPICIRCNEFCCLAIVGAIGVSLPRNRAQRSRYTQPSFSKQKKRKKKHFSHIIAKHIILCCAIRASAFKIVHN